MVLWAGSRWQVWLWLVDIPFIKLKERNVPLSVCSFAHDIHTQIYTQQIIFQYMLFVLPFGEQKHIYQNEAFDA